LSVISIAIVMALISIVELLRAPRLPKELIDRSPPLKPYSRSFIQGYFLSVANVSSRIAFFSLVLSPTANDSRKENVLPLFNTGSGAVPLATIQGVDGRLRFDFSLDAREAGLLILIPNLLSIALPDPYELRGYTELFLKPDTTGEEPQRVEVLTAAEHRSTYFNINLTAVGELVSSIPLAHGNALHSVEILRHWIGAIATPRPRPACPSTPVRSPS